MSDVRAIDDESLAMATRIVKDGGLVVLPTDTVYGVAASPFNTEAVSRIYEAKRRPRSKALQVLLSSVDNLDGLGLYLPVPLDRLAKAFLPGPFSPIAVAEAGSKLVTLRKEMNGSKTQAVRVPDSEACLRTLRATGPLACSSANRSGGESPQTVEEAVEALGDDIDLYLDGGPTVSHVASTVVAADANERDGISIVREGVISEAQVRSALMDAEGGSLNA
ncbi:L-threonylcarbamoyladenylate synthase [Bifidobacterium sp. ESL0745]|uniref:L-threonylcarbamoyladenylate synthase n=1 Tax=Bifidobacterium sp. ESL0745 TaxID=2983226 RepID=UPI0023F6252A|nr:L-threonylcarbamoyladenylate synthase [Bifidobacterium sp. ESL0745]MDF7665334.1 L-threonylcarbamoyladenylate synthase [Bifidobacterium sp. ESL0745]